MSGRASGMLPVFCLTAVHAWTAALADRADWYPFQIPVMDARVTAVHVGRLVLDPPAGKHGFLGIRDEDFVFEDGTPFRKWGTNLCFEALAPDKQDAPKLAARLAKLGFNAVRVHHIDNPKVLFQKQKTTRTFNADILDRLDFLIHELRRRGIYYNINLHVYRTFRSADGIVDGDRSPAAGKLVTLFYPPVIALEKEYARMLLTHRNPYTGLRYVDDPGMCEVQITNENSLWSAWEIGGLDRAGAGRNKHQLTKVFLDYLDRDFNRWLLRKYKDRDRLAQAWQGRRKGLSANEDPAGGTVKRIGMKQLAQFSSRRGADMVRFYYKLEADFFVEMKTYLKDELGVRVPVLGTNNYHGLPSLLSQAQADYTDIHVYWDHPKKFRKTQHSFRSQNNSYVADPVFARGPGDVNNLANILKCSLQQVHGMPLTVSEWNAGWQNPYFYELPLLMAAYGSLHGWAGLDSFAFAQNGWQYGEGRTAEYAKGIVNQPGYRLLNYALNICTNPVNQILSTVGALAFQRGDVREADTALLLRYSDMDIFGSYPSKHGTKDYFFWGKDVPLWAPYILPVKRDFASGGGDSGPFDKVRIQDPKRYESVTGELVWDVRSRGGERVVINTPRFQAVVGSLRGRRDACAALSVDGPGKAALGMISLDGEPLMHAKRALLFAVADCRGGNERREMQENGTMFWDPGELPILLEPVHARIHIKHHDAENVHVYVLDEVGARKRELPVDRSSRDALALTLGKAQSPWYEVVAQGEQDHE